MPALERLCEERLAALEAQSLRRELVEIESRDGVMIRVNGKEYISFSSNDYFGLSQHPEVIEANIEATKRYGVGAGASRLVTGNHHLYAPLEAALAEFKGKESALVLGSGYLANIAAITSLVGRGDLIIADKLVHACMIDGAKLSGAKLMRFSHNDVEHAEMLLEKYRGEYGQCLVMTESIFSMDGDEAPLKALHEVSKKYDTELLVDDAHGFGFPHLQTSLADVVVGTFSKAMGCYGGYISASNIKIESMLNFGRSFIFSTALPYGLISSINKSLELINQEKYFERIYKNKYYLCDGLKKPTIDHSGKSAILPFLVGEAADAVALQEKLKQEGLWVSAIRPPTVPQGTARLRITLNVLHEESHLSKLVEGLRKHG